MKPAAARQHRIGGQADAVAVREQRGDGGNAVCVMRAAESRHHDKLGCDCKIHVAGGLHLAVCFEPARRGPFAKPHPEMLRARPGTGIDLCIGVVLAGGAGQRRSNERCCRETPRQVCA